MNVRVLVLGASGMLGSALVQHFYQRDGYEVIGTVRDALPNNELRKRCRSTILSGVHATNLNELENVIVSHQPGVIVNCIGVVKQLKESSDPLIALPVNSLFPHHLLQLCIRHRARLIHISTDCVFSGKQGMYTEEDTPDATDLYGISKRLGEIDTEGAVTLRTSIIGHEIATARSLVNWFLSQNSSVNGFTQAIFSGLPTVELAKIVSDFVIPNQDLSGLFNVSSDPVSKYELLCLIARVYQKKIEIKQDNSIEIDRSLDSTKFRRVTGYQPPSWRDLVASMHAFR